MDDFENVSKLVSQTGSTFEEARYAYEACGKDMLAAAVMLEKAKKKNCSSTTGASGQCASYSDYQWDKDKFRQEFRRGARTAFDCTGGFISKLARNTLTVSGSRDYFTVPIIPSGAHLAAVRHKIHILRPRFFKGICIWLQQTCGQQCKCKD